MSATEAIPTPFELNCLTVLQCYSVRDAAAKLAVEGYNGWLDRIPALPEIDSADLSSIHGYLIAQGLIRFEFSGRNVGLQYQLSPQGREALGRQSLTQHDDLRHPECSGDSVPDSHSQAA